MKFRKKPVVVDAVLFDGSRESAKACGLTEARERRDGEVVAGAGTGVFGVETLEGFMVASPGDWVITGVNGERYPCKPDVFEKSYEFASASSGAAMSFGEALKLLKDGKGVRRAAWRGQRRGNTPVCVLLGKRSRDETFPNAPMIAAVRHPTVSEHYFMPDDLVADDWELVGSEELAGELLEAARVCAEAKQRGEEEPQ